LDGRENYICFEAIKTGNKNDPKKRGTVETARAKAFISPHPWKTIGFQIEGLERKQLSEKNKTNHSVFS